MFSSSFSQFCTKSTVSSPFCPSGCAGTFPIANLLQEMMEPHAPLLSAQLLAFTLCPKRCSHPVVTSDPSPRRMTDTLQKKITKKQLLPSSPTASFR